MGDGLIEDNSEDTDDKNKKCTSMDTSVQKMMKSDMVINCDSDKLQELKITNRDHMGISKIVADVAKQLRSNKAEFIAVESLGGGCRMSGSSWCGLRDKHLEQKDLCVPQHAQWREIL